MDSSDSFLHNVITSNFNVKLAFLTTFFQSFGRGVWMGNVLSAYIFLIAGESNEILGLTSAATGLAMTVVVLPAGAFADRISRKILLRGAAIFGFLGLVSVFLANDITVIFIALIFWGLFQGLARPSLEALFADSVETGNRSKTYAWYHAVRQVAMAVGPFVNVALFLVLGDVWGIEILKTVITVGLSFSLVSLILMLFFDDKKSLGIESEHLSLQNEIYEGVNDHISKDRFLLIFILIASNLTIGFGAGMTIRFFPIFFMKIYDMTPILVQLIMGFTQIFTALAGLIAQTLSLQRGRAEMIFIVQGIATMCLAVIATYPPIWLLVPIFLARGSLMNASQPLSRSIMMDVVSKKSRGKINAIQTLSFGLFWNISAAIGGFLIGPNNNFAFCFWITSGLYVFGTALILLLIPLVAKEKHSIQY